MIRLSLSRKRSEMSNEYIIFFSQRSFGRLGRWMLTTLRTLFQCTLWAVKRHFLWAKKKDDCQPALVCAAQYGYCVSSIFPTFSPTGENFAFHRHVPDPVATTVSKLFFLSLYYIFIGIGWQIFIYVIAEVFVCDFST